MSRSLVIVGGAPATGKTTLARELGRSLELPVITKDDIKEALAAPFQTGDRDWSRQTSTALSMCTRCLPRAARSAKRSRAAVREATSRCRNDEGLRTRLREDRDFHARRYRSRAMKREWPADWSE